MSSKRGWESLGNQSEMSREYLDILDLDKSALEKKLEQQFRETFQSVIKDTAKTMVDHRIVSKVDNYDQEGHCRFA